MLTQTNAPLRIPDTIIDRGSSVWSFASAANAKNGFTRLLLPKTAATSSSTLQAAFAYVGKGILQAYVGVSQNAFGNSTAAGLSMGISIDGSVVYAATPASAANQLAVVVGELAVINPATEVVMVTDGRGLAFNKSLILTFNSGTNLQGVQVGWRVLKLH